MDFIAGLALVLLTLVGYSSGSVLGAKRRTSIPNIADLLVVFIMWIIAFSTRNAYGKWGVIGIWLAIGVFMGAVLAYVRVDSFPKSQLQITTNGLWKSWKRFAQQMGNYQSRMLLAFLYFVLVLPFGLAVTFLGDPLNINHGHSNSNWWTKELPLKPSVDEARRQF